MGNQATRRGARTQRTRLSLLFFFSATAAISTLPAQQPPVRGTREFSSDDAVTQITKQPTDGYCVRWSPDGSMLAFASQRSGEAKIWLVPAQGGNPVMLETGLPGDHHVSWSPDSKRIAFDARLGNAPPSIFTIGVDGGKPTRLSKDGAADFHPSWFA